MRRSENNQDDYKDEYEYEDNYDNSFEYEDDYAYDAYDSGNSYDDDYENGYNENEYNEYEEDFNGYNDDPYYDDEYYDDEAPYAQRLTVKERVAVASRRDRMGKLHPTWYRILGLALVLLVAIEVISYRQTTAIAASSPEGVPVSEDEIQLSFVGDISLARGAAVYGESESYTSLFQDSKALWANSDLVFANLECAVIQQNATYRDTSDGIKLASTYTAVHMMANAGVNAVSLANNHVADYGRLGVQHTIEAMERYGISYAGAGANQTDAAAYRLFDLDGVSVAFLAFTDVIPFGVACTATMDSYGLTSSNYSGLYQQVYRASQEADVVIVYAHWGEENYVSVTDEQQQIAHQLIESGADIVIGSHPHVLQEIEEYRDGIIFYSLGNYIFDQSARSARNTVMVQLNINKKTGKGYFTLIPMRINDFHACVTDSNYYISQIQSSLLRSLSPMTYWTTDDGRIHIPLQIFDPDEQDERNQTDSAASSVNMDQEASDADD